MYRSLLELKKIENIEELELYFLINYEIEGVMYSEELIENGGNIQVKNDNLDQYIEERYKFIKKRIEHLIKKDIPYYNEFRTGFLSVKINFKFKDYKRKNNFYF